MGSIFASYIAPYLLEWIITAALGYALALLQRWTGISVEAKRREALQSALRNAAIRALDDLSGRVDSGKALSYVRLSVPDTLDYFKLDDFDVERLLEPHVDAVRKLLKGQANLPL